MFEIKTNEFSGPLQLLLELIEAERLDITEVSLIKVTDDYWQYINQSCAPAEELADFLVVASRLLYLKSRAILPDLSADDEEATSLTEQLKMYQRFARASQTIAELYGQQRVMYRSEGSIQRKGRSFAPSPRLTVAVLSETLRGVVKRLEPFLALRKASLRRVVSVQERIKNIQQAILERARFNFSELASVGSKMDVVVNFLALLELIKQKIVFVSQSGLFNDINIKRVD